MWVAVGDLVELSQSSHRLNHCEAMGVGIVVGSRVEDSGSTRVVVMWSGVDAPERITEHWAWRVDLVTSLERRGHDPTDPMTDLRVAHDQHLFEDIL